MKFKFTLLSLLFFVFLSTGANAFYSTSKKTDKIAESLVLPNLEVNKQAGNCFADFYYSQDWVNPLLFYFDDASFSNQPITSWYWEFGDGNTSSLQYPSHTYATSGYYEVGLTIGSANCSSSTIYYIYVGMAPDCMADFYYDFDWQNSTTIYFYDYSYANQTITSWSWDFGDGNTSSLQEPVHTYANTGMYLVTLSITADTCSSSFTLVVYVDNIVINDCESYFYYYMDWLDPMSFHFVDISYSNAPITSWSWNFGDGTTSSQPSPTHIYANTGFYQVTLSIIADTCVSSYTDFVYVDGQGYPDCQADFYYDQDWTNPLMLFFYDGSYGSQTVNSWFWEFGDGSSSTQQNPTHTYATTGSYSVSLSIVADSCTSTEIYVVYVDTTGFPDCQADFYYDQSWTDPMTFSFYDYSFSIDPITSWLWDFGDGSTSSLQNPQHTYITPGFYEVSLIIEAGFCIGSLVYYIYVDTTSFPDCQADFYYNQDPWNPMSFYFYDNSYSIDPITSWLWDFGDGNTSSQPNPNHTYASAGLYEVVLLIQAGNCNSSEYYYIYADTAINTDCDASFYYNQSTTNPLEVAFFNISTSIDPILYTYWDFDDGNFSNQTNPVHTYATDGGYSVTIYIETVNGCIDAYTQFIEINSGSVAECESYFLYDHTIGMNFLFTAQANSTEPILSYEWDYGDGNVSNLMNAEHTYTVPGFYQVSLTITTANCTDTYSTFVHAYGENELISGDAFWTPGMENCFALFYPVIDGLTVDFYNLSIVGALTVLPNSTWYFGDGNSSTEHSPTHTYTESGVYIVNLIINTGSCSSLFQMELSLHSTTSWGVDCQALFYPIAGSNPNSIHFIDLSPGNPSAWTWSFGGGQNSSLQHPGHEFASAGLHTIGLTIDHSGCMSTMMMDIDLDSETFMPMVGIIPIGIKEPSLESSISVYPNPVSDVLNFSFESSNSEVCQLKLFDITGKLLHQENFPVIIGRNLHQLDFSPFPAGVYQVKWTQGFNQQQVLIVK